MTSNRFPPLHQLKAQLLRSRTLLTASLGHFSVDIFSGILPLILLVQRDALGLSYAQVGLISMTFSISSSITQPFFGWLGDRWGHGRLMVIGAAAAGLAMSAMLAVDQFALLVAIATCSGLASGAFHPQGAAVAAQVSPERRGSALSIFMLGGNLGYSFGPLLATFALAVAGRYTSFFLGALGFFFAVLIFWLSRASSRLRAAPRRASGATAARAALSLVITVTLVVFLRSWVQSSVSTYIPQLFKDQGASTTVAGNVLFSILLPLAAGGLIGGTLSDRVGRRRVLLVSTALIGPALWGLLHAQGLMPFVVGPLLGVALGASVPVTIVMTQELVPRGAGLMSGIAMGLNFISGAIGVWVTGLLADQIGLYSALSLSVVIPLLAAALGLFLPADRVESRVREQVQRA